MEGLRATLAYFKGKGNQTVLQAFSGIFVNRLKTMFIL